MNNLQILTNTYLDAVGMLKAEHARELRKLEDKIADLRTEFEQELQRILESKS